MQCTRRNQSSRRGGSEEWAVGDEGCLRHVPTCVRVRVAQTARGHWAWVEDHSISAPRRGHPDTGDGPDAWNEDRVKGRAAVLGFFIDEEFQGALKKEVLLTPEDMLTAGELPKLMSNSDDEYRRSAAIGHVRSAMKTPGPLKHAFFNRFDAYTGGEFPQKKIDRICSLLGRLWWSMRDEASEKVGDKLKEGGLPPDIPNLARKLRLVSSLLQVL